jgi:hypothetical protein
MHIYSKAPTRVLLELNDGLSNAVTDSFNQEIFRVSETVSNHDSTIKLLRQSLSDITIAEPILLTLSPPTLATTHSLLTN